MKYRGIFSWKVMHADEFICIWFSHNHPHFGKKQLCPNKFKISHHFSKLQAKSTHSTHLMKQL